MMRPCESMIVRLVTNHNVLDKWLDLFHNYLITDCGVAENTPFDQILPMCFAEYQKHGYVIQYIFIGHKFHRA